MRKPSFAIDRAGTDDLGPLRRPPAGPRVHLAGAGAAAGRRPPVASDAQDIIEQVQAPSTATYRSRPISRQSCQNCPDVVQALNLMSVLNPRIRHAAIDGALFQAEVEKRGR